MKDLVETFKKIGINLSENQQKQFDLYFSFLIETNQKFNLTTITEENEVLIKHFVDSVLPDKLLPQNASVIDVGSGAGFPALPLKIVRPDLKITMLDALNKRVNFLNETTQLLKLENATAVHARAEEFASKNREVFDVAVARAVAPLNTLLEYLLPFVKVGGQAIIYKSTKLEEELAAAQKAIFVLGGKIVEIKTYQLFDLDRKILVIKKVGKTPAKYPRLGNKPKTNPIN